MSHRRRVGLCLILSLTAFRTVATAQEHLEPITKGSEIDRYLTDTREVFRAAYSAEVILRALEAPALGVENVVGLRKTNNGYEAFTISLVQPTSAVGDLEQVRKIKACKVGGVAPDGTIKGEEHSPYVHMLQVTPASPSEFKTKIDAASISMPLTKRIAAAWEKMVLAAKPPTETREGFDGVTYLFSISAKGRAVVDAQIWSPRLESKTVV